MTETYELIAWAGRVLAELYLDSTSARRVAAGAGLNLSQIEFSDRPVNNWRGILEEANKQGRVVEVLDVALKEYDQNAELKRVREAWAAHEGAAGGPAAKASADPAELAALKRQLANSQESLRLIEERKAEYVLEVDVPLQLVREERRLRERIADLERRIAGQ